MNYKYKKFHIVMLSGLSLVLCGCILWGCGRRTPDPRETVPEPSVTVPEEPEKTKKREEPAPMKKKTYRLFAVPEGAWVGDVMPMADESGIQLYYLYETDFNGMGFHPIHKFSTQNLYHYQDDGLMLPFGTSAEDEDLAIGTGSVLFADGKYHCFYTGHNYLFPEQGKDKECVMHAISEDNKTWIKIPEDTFYAPEGYDGDNFRDPFVFWNEAEQCYWLLIATRENGYGITARFTSSDLSHWELAEPIFTPEKQFMLECPDLFQMGDTFYLFYSWDNVTYYAVSDSPEGPFRAAENNTLDGKAFYAAKTTEYQGRRYLFGWVGRKIEEKDTSDYDWAGNLCVYEIIQGEDGGLRAKMPDQYFDYFQTELPLPEGKSIGAASMKDREVTLEGSGEALAGIEFDALPETFLLTAKLTLQEKESRGGFAFGGTDGLENSFGILIDGKEQMLRYDHSLLSRIRYADPDVFTRITLKPGIEYDVKLVVEHEIIVLYVGEEKVLSSRIYRAPGNKWGLFNMQGSMRFSDLRLFIPEMETED